MSKGSQLSDVFAAACGVQFFPRSSDNYSIDFFYGGGQNINEFSFIELFDRFKNEQSASLHLIETVSAVVEQPF